jgi:hypothetical protein
LAEVSVGHPEESKLFPEESKVCGAGAGLEGRGGAGAVGCGTTCRRTGWTTGGAGAAEEEVRAGVVAVTGRAGALGRDAVMVGATA